MRGEFGAVIEGDGLAPGGGQRGEQRGQPVGDGGGGLAGEPGGEEQAGVALMEGQNDLAVEAEQHQVGLPVAGGLAGGDGRGPLSPGAARGDEGGGAPAFGGAAPALGFGVRQIVPPRVRGVAAQLGRDEAGDGFVGEDRAVLLHRQAAGHLLGRPAVLEARQHRRPEFGVAVESRARPAAGAGLVVGIAGAIALGGRRIAGQLASQARWRAIQSCRNLAEGVSRCL